MHLKCIEVCRKGGVAIKESRQTRHGRNVKGGGVGGRLGKVS